MTSGGEFDLEGLLEGVQKFQQDVAGSSQRLAVEVADAWSEDHLVRVWVNARGVVIDAEVDERELPSATAEGIAAATVQAAQAAAAKMQEKVTAFQADLRQRLAGLAPAAMTSLTDIPELGIVQPSIPTSPPTARDRLDNATSNQETTSGGNAGDQDGWDFTLRG
ncbi:YbaB/EbfC family nucleoid-associated protein [Mycobacterium sp. BMJ-28]